MNMGVENFLEAVLGMLPVEQLPQVVFKTHLEYQNQPPPPRTTVAVNGNQQQIPNASQRASEARTQASKAGWGMDGQYPQTAVKEDFYDPRLEHSQTQAVLMDGMGFLRTPFANIRLSSSQQVSLLHSDRRFQFSGSSRYAHQYISYKNLARGIVDLIEIVFLARPNTVFVSMHFDRFAPVFKHTAWRERDLQTQKRAGLETAHGRHACDLTSSVSNSNNAHSLVGQDVFGVGDYFRMLDDRVLRNMMLQNLGHVLQEELHQWITERVPLNDALRNRRMVVLLDGPLVQRYRVQSILAQRIPRGTSPDSDYRSECGAVDWDNLPAGEGEQSLMRTLHRIYASHSRDDVLQGLLSINRMEVMSNDSDLMAQLMLFVKQRSVRSSSINEDRWLSRQSDGEAAAGLISLSHTEAIPYLLFRYMNKTKFGSNPYIEMSSLVQLLEMQSSSPADREVHGEFRVGAIESMLAVLLMGGSDYVPKLVPGVSNTMVLQSSKQALLRSDVCVIDYRAGVVYLDERKVIDTSLNLCRQAVVGNASDAVAAQKMDRDFAIDENSNRDQTFDVNDSINFLRQQWLITLEKLKLHVTEDHAYNMWIHDMDRYLEQEAVPLVREMDEDFPVDGLSLQEQKLLCALYLGSRKLTNVHNLRDVFRITTVFYDLSLIRRRTGLSPNQVQDLIEALRDKVLEAYAADTDTLELRKGFLGVLVNTITDERNLEFLPNFEWIVNGALNKFAADENLTGTELLEMVVGKVSNTVFDRARRIQDRLRIFYDFFRKEDTMRSFFWRPLNTSAYVRAENRGVPVDQRPPRNMQKLMAPMCNTLYSAILWQMVYWLVGWTSAFSVMKDYSSFNIQDGPNRQVARSWAWKKDGVIWSLSDPLLPSEQRAQYAAFDIVRLKEWLPDVPGLTAEFYNFSVFDPDPLAAVRSRVASVKFFSDDPDSESFTVKVCAGWLGNAVLYQAWDKLYESRSRVVMYTDVKKMKKARLLGYQTAQKSTESYPFKLDQFLLHVQSTFNMIFRVLNPNNYPNNNNTDPNKVWSYLLQDFLSCVFKILGHRALDFEVMRQIMCTLAPLFVTMYQNVNSLDLFFSAISEIVKKKDEIIKLYPSRTHLGHVVQAPTLFDQVMFAIPKSPECLVALINVKHRLTLLNRNDMVNEEGRHLCTHMDYMGQHPNGEKASVVMGTLRHLQECAARTSNVPLWIKEDIAADGFAGYTISTTRWNVLLNDAQKKKSIGLVRNMQLPGVVPLETKLCQVPARNVEETLTTVFNREVDFMTGDSNNDRIENYYQTLKRQSSVAIEVTEKSDLQSDFLNDPRVVGMDFEQQLMLTSGCVDLPNYYLKHIDVFYLLNTLHGAYFRQFLAEIPRQPSLVRNMPLLVKRVYNAFWESSRFSRGVFMLARDLKTFSAESQRNLALEFSRTLSQSMQQADVYSMDNRRVRQIPDVSYKHLQTNDMHEVWWTAHPAIMNAQADLKFDNTFLVEGNSSSMPSDVPDVMPQDFFYDDAMRKNASLSFPDGVIASDKLRQLPCLPSVRYLVARKPNQPESSYVLGVEFDTSYREWDPITSLVFLMQYRMINVPLTLRENQAHLALYSAGLLSRPGIGVRGMMRLGFSFDDLPGHQALQDLADMRRMI